MTPYQVTYPNTLRETLITYALSPLIALGLACVLVLEFALSGPARKVS